ncbi:MAG: hypothetical protein DRI89_04610 [Bacteroidetes bacterium]|nr:MAG: hypothetical protein DRI89_04610 [Bacteroidota bacterium]
MKRIKNNITMKTLLQSATLIVIITLVFTTNSFASEVNFKDEAYIDDIPFSTEMIFNSIMNPEFNMEEEAFIDDIPFNTSLMVDFEMEEEAFINDNPFSTEEIAEYYTTTQAADFQMDAEAYIDDIPFNTAKVANHNNQGQLFAAR